MAQVEVVSPAKSTYNAVNIKINNPKANISGINTQGDTGRDYNAVNLEINEPELEQTPVYSYPDYDGLVTADMAIISYTAPDLKELPAPNNDTESQDAVLESEKAPIEVEETPAEDGVVVPKPYLTTSENEKNLAFHGISFRAGNKPEIVPDGNIKPAVNINKVSDKLTSTNLDIQAKQMEEIVVTALKDSKAATKYISTLIFSDLINIAERDTSALEGPTEEQTTIRQQIIANEIAVAQQKKEGKKANEIELPYTISDKDFAKAIVLSPMEMAERNKEYALLTLAALSKIYTEEFKEKTGNVVPLTDLPGASTMVEALRSNPNPSIRIAAIESLVYLNRPEYDKEITAVLIAATEDKHIAVSSTAVEALKAISAQKS